MGQVLPTHRLDHSVHGGLFQPTMTQAIRLLSKGPFPPEPHTAPGDLQRWHWDNLCVDPFSEVETAYTTTGKDSYLAPSAYVCNSYSWVHVFPEGKIHQTKEKIMRYFKWGVSRLILEPPECPDVIPIWIEGMDEIMPENRRFPRFAPRPFKQVSVTFGDKVDSEAVFGELRRRWLELKAKSDATAASEESPLGILRTDLMYGEEAVQLRKECTRKVRELVLAVRKTRGLPDEDPKVSLAETWMQEVPKKEDNMKDESWANGA